jgi:ADP-heptose:LPS heptosyltransferase
VTSLKKINFFIIQKDFDKNKMKIINKYSNVNYFEDMDKTVKAFEDTIGIIKNLDLIITADTSLAHLSATLGKKTWIVLPFVSDWRWFRDEKKSIWYENVTLYKQKQIGNWEEVFHVIKEDLKKEFPNK